MKKLLLTTLIFCASLGLYAQSKTTGVVTLSSNMTAEMLLNDNDDTVTLTFTGPSDRWYALQFGNFNTGAGMQNGTDVVYYNGTTLVDAVQNSIGSAPSIDANNNWTVNTNTVAGGIRTIIATRALNTGDANDYTFNYSDTNVDFAWARGSSASFALSNHGGSNRGYSINNFFECVAPDAPTASSQSFCDGATVADLDATGEAGATLSWYASATGGTALASSASLSTGTYYVSQTADACESDRTSVSVTVTVTSAPTADATQNLCDGSTVLSLTASGTMLNWYDVATGGTPLESSTVLTSGNYYVDQTIDGCTSPRTEVTVNISPLSNPIVEDQTFCGQVIVGVITVETVGNQGFLMPVYYDVPTGGEPIDVNAIITESGTYYVSQTNGWCESGREEVNITINLIPIAPMGDDIQQFDAGETVADLEVNTINGATITWYTMNTNMQLVEIDTATALTDGGEYYVTQTVDGCESLPFKITANENLGTITFAGNSFKVYPNPVDNVFTISGATTIAEVKIVNLLGQEVMRKQFNAEEVTVNIEQLPQGTYIAQIATVSGATAAYKIMKK